MRILHPYADKEDHHIELSPPQDSETCRRAAPEVEKDGLYSHASDVFCFGRLMWWVVNTFCETKDDVPRSYSRIYYKIHPLLEEKPSACPPRIYSLIKGCCTPDRCQRPPFHVVQEYLSSTDRQFLVDIGQERTEDGDIDKYNNTSDSSGFHSSSKTNRESEIGSAESMSLFDPQQEDIPCLASEPPPITPRHRKSSLTPPSLQEQNSYSSHEFSFPPLPPFSPDPPRQREKSVNAPSPPPKPSLSPSQTKPFTLVYNMFQSSRSPTPLTPIEHSSHTNLPSPQPRPPMKVRSIFLPSSVVSSKPQEELTLTSSLETLSSVSSDQLTPSSSIVDPDLSSLPVASSLGATKDQGKEWVSETDVSGSCTRKTRRKTRNKTDPIKEFTYDVADSLSDTIHVKGEDNEQDSSSLA